jgi:hypothetical protein
VSSLLVGLALCDWLLVGLGTKRVSSFNGVVLKQTPLPLLYTERQFKLLKNVIYGSHSYKQLQEEFLLRECALSYRLVSTPMKFPTHNKCGTCEK